MLERLGKYEIVGKIGQGAMGEVYRAHDPILGRDVAIKTMAASIGSDAEQRGRFHREAQSAARLNHPNIITVYDFGEEQGHAYIAMELLEGSDLKDLVAAGPPFPLDRTLDLMDQLCEGLAFAHSKGVVHRDLKPANVHVQANGQVKVMDFGLAKVASSDMTRAGTIMGTPNYMSPEQVRGEKATSRSDVFSLGVLFYELLTSQRAFDADSLHAVLFQVMKAEPKDVTELCPDLPESLVEIVRRAMHKELEQRFADAGEMRDALRAARAEFAPKPASPARTLQSNRGSLALKPAPTQLAQPETAAFGQPTLMPPAEATRVQARTVAPPRAEAHTRLETPAPAVGRRSIALLVSAVAVMVVGGVWIVLRLMGPGPEPTPQPTPTPVASVAQSPAPLQGLISGSALPAAQRAFAEHDYAAAVERARRAISAEPDNAEARALLEKAQRALSETTLVAGQLGAALESGDVARAQGLLPRLEQLDPRQAAPLQARLRDLLAGRAQEARRSAHAAQQALDATRAALPEAQDGQRELQQGEASFLAKDLPSAALHFGAARDAFERARRASLGRPSTAPTALPTAVARQTPAPTTPPPTAAPSALATPPATATAAPMSEAAARQAIRGVLDEFRQAFENRNADALRAVQPGVDYQYMKSVFAQVKSYTVKIDVKSVSVGPNGTTASAETLVTYLPNPNPSGKLPPVTTIFHVRRSGDLWQIERLEKK